MMEKEEELIIEEVPELDPSDPYPRVPLRHVMDAIGGLEGYKRNPFTGKRHRVSLAQWANRDPDKTFIRFGFAFMDPNLMGKKRPRKVEGK